MARVNSNRMGNSDYYAEYQNFFQDSTLESVLGMNQAKSSE